MIATLREQFRELLAAASLREESAVFYEDLCRLEARSLEGFTRLAEALSRLGAPPVLRSALAQRSRERVAHARLAGMLARREGLVPAAGQRSGAPFPGSAQRSGAPFMDDDCDCRPRLGGTAPDAADLSEARRQLLRLSRACSDEAVARQGFGDLLRASAGGRGPMRAATLRTLAEDEARAAQLLAAISDWARRAAIPAADGRALAQSA